MPRLQPSGNPFSPSLPWVLLVGNGGWAKHFKLLRQRLSAFCGLQPPRWQAAVRLLALASPDLASAHWWGVGPPPGYYYDPYYDAYYDDPYYYGDYLGDDDPRPLSNRYRIRAYQRSETPVARTPTDAPVKTPAYTGSSVGQSEAKLKAAQAKAEKLGGVEKLRSEDVDGLNREQLKKLRGY